MSMPEISSGVNYSYGGWGSRTSSPFAYYGRVGDTVTGKEFIVMMLNRFGDGLVVTLAVVAVVAAFSAIA
jgi:hypothetical protein